MKFAFIVFTLTPILLASCASVVTAQESGTAATSQPAQGAALDNSTAPNVAGDWQASWTAANGSRQQGTMQIKQNGSKLSGTFQVERGSARVKGSLKGNQISLTIEAMRQVFLTGTVDGDKMSGTTDQGVAWTAARAQSQSSQLAVQPNVVDAFSMGRLPTMNVNLPRSLTVGQKFAYFEKPVFGPREIVVTAAFTGISMAHPRPGYPPEWKDGAGAFGRNYGNGYARSAASSFARFSSDALFHEDPRYSPSTSDSFSGRFAHALEFTFIDKTDGGHSTPAFANFAGAVAAGFVGNAYLPAGWNDTTHAGQRSLEAFGGFAAQNVVQEFAPEIGRAFKRLHFPKLPLPPEWW